ncbi:protein of unknown function DUF218 [Thermincola potens JR]|uniref:DUF218 domain-containing protein n=1 Tax=Thermincola potens (strain JR) TaxID=635013 RepID=D5XE08_THEPJ|nr:ElyC/SanA/YdcF family protein [Thermincola potens]ADG81879.1 protein of unknown function DUF218 [Thermincola potens JR]
MLENSTVGRAKLKEYRKKWVTGSICLFLGVLTVLSLVFTYYCHKIDKNGKTGVYTSAEDMPPATVAIVLGAKVYPNGGVSTVLADRLNTGVELYKAGKVKKILLTGDHGQTNYDEVNTMREFMLRKGIPAEDIFMDHAGFSTYDSMYRARDVFRVKDAVVVTQQFHLPRALYIARTMGIEATGLIADKRTYTGARYLEFREALARVKALLQLHVFKSKPKYLGPAIPISGDGRVTCDKV